MMANRLVIKFGGVDLSTGKNIKKAAQMVVKSGFKEIIVVVSAMGSTTSNLIKTISNVGNISDQEYADIVSMGERTSARLFCSALRLNGANAEYVDPSSKLWPIITDSKYRNAKPIMEQTCSLVRLYIEPLVREKIIVICGFLGRDEEGNITTLGRGGSDTTAMILGNCLNAEEIILVKETEGILTADPKKVTKAKPIKRIDIEEMFALSYGGAKVIKAESLKYKLPNQKLRVVSFSNGLTTKGTNITGVFNSSSPKINEIKGLSAVCIVCPIQPDSVSKIISMFGKRKIYGISTGKVSLTIFASSENSDSLIKELHDLDICKALSYKSNIGLIDLTHPDFVDSPGWIARISGALASEEININEITTSRSTISIFIDENEIKKAVSTVRDAFET